MLAIGSLRDPYVTDREALANAVTLTKTVSDPRPIAGERTCVFLVAGESMVANTGPTPYVPTNIAKLDNVNVFDGGTYRLADPLLGASGLTGGSWVSRFGDQLIDQDICDRAIFITIGVNSTKAEDWSTGRWKDFLAVAYRRLDALGLPITAVLWQLGANDGLAGTSTAAMTSALQDIIARFRSETGSTAPWIMALSTWYGFIGPIPMIRAGIIGATNGVDILIGPDTDTLDNSKRSDGVHFNDVGMAEAAILWAASFGAIL
jgi:lysophospholipase L1-like esterase